MVEFLDHVVGVLVGDEVGDLVVEVVDDLVDLLETGLLDQEVLEDARLRVVAHE